MAETAKLLRDGTVQPVQIKNAKNTDTLKSEPGSVVILARPFTLGERLFYPFVKQ
jgi:hypothetical protein